MVKKKKEKKGEGREKRVGQERAGYEKEGGKGKRVGKRTGKRAGYEKEGGKEGGKEDGKEKAGG